MELVLNTVQDKTVPVIMMYLTDESHRLQSEHFLTAREREREFSMAMHRTSQTFAPPKEDMHVEPVEGLKLSNLNHNFSLSGVKVLCVCIKSHGILRMLQRWRFVVTECRKVHVWRC